MADPLTTLQGDLNVLATPVCKLAKLTALDKP